MVIFCDTHDITSFVPAGAIAHTEFDPTKSTTSTSDGNYAVSSDISDNRYVCDTPLSVTNNGCSCSVGGAGLVNVQGRVFPGSALGGSQSVTMGALGLKPGVNGVPHPSFRFAQPVTDVSIRMDDITRPGHERPMWEQRFRLTQPDGSLGGKYLPSSQAPISQEGMSFHKMCAPMNSWHVYKLHITAGGQAAIDQTMVLKTYIVKPDSLMDPTKIGKEGSAAESVTSSGVVSMKSTGERFSEMTSPPGADTASAVKASSFAGKYLAQSGPILIRSDQRHFPSATVTSFADEDCCGCDSDLHPLKNPIGCHNPPIVTIHTPSQYAMNFL